MRRKALLIWDKDTDLRGVKVDIANWKAFLQSDEGGAWGKDEIEKCVNYSVADLLSKIEICRKEEYDFVLVVFSGHGNYRNGTNLIISHSGDSILESVLNKIAPRQINVFDCCRSYIEETKTEGTQLFGFITGSTKSSQIRAQYDTRIMSAPEQQVNLYACSIGEGAIDTPQGGLYTQILLKHAKDHKNNVPFKTVNNIHDKTADLLKWIFITNKDIEQKQSPEIVCIPEYHDEEDQLILSINPDIITY